MLTYRNILWQLKVITFKSFYSYSFCGICTLPRKMTSFLQFKNITVLQGYGLKLGLAEIRFRTNVFSSNRRTALAVVSVHYTSKNDVISSVRKHYCAKNSNSKPLKTVKT